MAVRKRKNTSGKIVWCYRFNAPGSTRENRKEIREFGFATKEEAITAEAERRTKEQEKYELAKAGSAVALAPPKTLAMLLDEFMRQHAREKLAPKTIERYQEHILSLDKGLLAMALPDIKPLHLSREWTRLLKSGGHHRKTKEPRPLGAKSVRHIAGMISSAFNRAVIWGLVSINPVRASEPPRPSKRRASALTVEEQDALIAGATGPWCITAFLKVGAALGARRGEVLALRWSDISGSRVRIERSLTQTREAGVEFKGTKTGESRTVVLTGDAMATLEEHRIQQDAHRQRHGQDYRADLDLVFANPDGTPLSPNSISATISKLFRRLGIPKPKGNALHLLRHTMTSQMLAAGVPVAVVSARLGHKSIRTTLDIYSHMITGQDEEAVQKWEEYQRQCREAAGATKTVQ
jgi:integrase